MLIRMLFGLYYMDFPPRLRTLLSLGNIVTLVSKKLFGICLMIDRFLGCFFLQPFFFLKVLSTGHSFIHPVYFHNHGIYICLLFVPVPFVSHVLPSTCSSIFLGYYYHLSFSHTAIWCLLLLALEYTVTKIF